MKRFAALLAIAAFAASPAFSAGLEPFQMVRALQLVQDRIVNGDHAAMPMQRKLLEMIDERVRAATPELFENPKNVDAVLVYAMSGGNPATIEATLARLPLEGDRQALGKGIVDYVFGRPASAAGALEKVEPMALDPEVGAFLALVKGSLAALTKPESAMRYFDQARLLAPGSLVEEAALRRSISAAIALKDDKRFLTASGQYVRRFLNSPYASQFADVLVNGVVGFHKEIKPGEIEEIVAAMTPEQRRAIYLRLARKGAIEGLLELSEHAAGQAARDAGASSGGNDARADLYSALGSLTSETVVEVSKNLAGIDRSKLSPGDRPLLDAALEVTRGVLAVPEAMVKDPQQPEPASQAHGEASEDGESAKKPKKMVRSGAAEPAPKVADAGHKPAKEDDSASRDLPVPRSKKTKPSSEESAPAAAEHAPAAHQADGRKPAGADAPHSESAPSKTVSDGNAAPVTEDAHAPAVAAENAQHAPAPDAHPSEAATADDAATSDDPGFGAADKAFIDTTRKTLGDIDKLLEETKG